MLKLARWSTTHRKYILLGWVVLLVGVNALAHALAGTNNAPKDIRQSRPGGAECG